MCPRRQINALNGDTQAWVIFFRDWTHSVEDTFERLGSVDWVTAHRQRKWTFAGNVARATDGRWNQKLLQWKPLWGNGRGPGRPRLRWIDDFLKIAGGNWHNHAQDEQLWSLLESGFTSGSVS